MDTDAVDISKVRRKGVQKGRLLPRLHLTFVPIIVRFFSLCDFPYDVLDIVGDRGLRRMCLK